MWSISTTIAAKHGIRGTRWHAGISATEGIPFGLITLDNGSTQTLSDAEVRSFGPEFQYRFVPTQSVSPVEAINAACRDATGEQLLIGSCRVPRKPVLLGDGPKEALHVAEFSKTVGGELWRKYPTVMQ